MESRMLYPAMVKFILEKAKNSLGKVEKRYKYHLLVFLVTSNISSTNCGRN